MYMKQLSKAVRCYMELTAILKAQIWLLTADAFKTLLNRASICRFSMLRVFSKYISKAFFINI